MMAAVRQAHAWATRELATAEAGSIREFCLSSERERLAAIAWRLKREEVDGCLKRPSGAEDEPTLPPGFGSMT